MLLFRESGSVCLEGEKSSEIEEERLVEVFLPSILLTKRFFSPCVRHAVAYTLTLCFLFSIISIIFEGVSVKEEFEPNHVDSS